MAADQHSRSNCAGSGTMNTAELNETKQNDDNNALADQSEFSEDRIPEMYTKELYTDELYPDQHIDEYSEYEEYAAIHDPQWAADWLEDERQRPNDRKEQRSLNDAINELTDGSAGLEAGFQTTYKPTRYEETYLLEALRYFYDIGLIEDVLASVKGGKEASVYRCKPNEMMEVNYLAAKVYRPRRFRNLRNDRMYREGREVLSGTGKTVKANQRRVFAAINKKTSFGVQAAHTSWMMHEYAIMDDLWNAGANVPKPYAVSENAILMGYVGDGVRSAPTLHEIDIDAGDAKALFDTVMKNVEFMLQLGVIHGDLSAYNILYWEGDITLIDFPQITDVHANPNAHRILARDIRRVCDYFIVRDVVCDPYAITLDLWQQYNRNPISLQDVVADLSREQEEEE